MIRPLIWKEWQEQRWKLVFSCLAIATFVSIGLKTRVMPDVGIFVITLMGPVLLMPIFVATGLFATEREDGTFALQQWLPVASWKVYIVKVMVGSAVVMVPILLSMALSLFLAGGREITYRLMFTAYLNGIAFALSMLVYIAVFSLKCNSEAKVFVVAVIIYAVFIVMVLIDDMFLHNTFLNRISLVITPWGFIEAGVDGGAWKSVLLVQSIFSAMVLVAGMICFRRLAGRQ